MSARRVDGQRLDVTDLNRQREPVIELTSDFGRIKMLWEQNAFAQLGAVAIP